MSMLADMLQGVSSSGRSGFLRGKGTGIIVSCIFKPSANGGPTAIVEVLNETNSETEDVGTVRSIVCVIGAGGDKGKAAKSNLMSVMTAALNASDAELAKNLELINGKVFGADQILRGVRLRFEPFPKYTKAQKAILASNPSADVKPFYFHNYAHGEGNDEASVLLRRVELDKTHPQVK